MTDKNRATLAYVGAIMAFSIPAYALCSTLKPQEPLGWIIGVAVASAPGFFAIRRSF